MLRLVEAPVEPKDARRHLVLAQVLRLPRPPDSCAVEAQSASSVPSTLQVSRLDE